MFEKKKFSIGSWIQCSNSNSVELISKNNFDWSCIDFEHGVYDFSNIQDIVRSIKINKKKCFVRTLTKNTKEISKLMDMGIDGLFIPQIEKVEEVKKIYNSMYFYPKGKRGVAFTRANFYGKEFKKNLRNSNKNLIIGMIESKLGVKNLEKILNTNLLNAIFVGPYDLSASLGKPGNFKTKEFKKSLDEILNTCKKFKIPCGIHLLNNDHNSLKEIKEKGYSFIAFLTDSLIISNYKPI